MRRSTARFRVALAFVATLPACSGAPSNLASGEPCVRSAQCQSGLVCNMGACTADLTGFGMGVVPSADAGRGIDAGMDIDAGPDADGGPPIEIDAGPAVDAGPGTPDAGSMGMDAGPMEPDAGPMEMDAGPTEMDAGPMETDAGM